MTESLSLDDAERVVAGARARAVELGLSVSIAVVSAEARIVAFARMDGTLLAGTFGAQAKACLAAAFGVPTSSLVGLSGTALLAGAAEFEGVPMLAVPGAVPIRRGGRVIGACGVGGASPEHDEDCAAVGARVL